MKHYLLFIFSDGVGPILNTIDHTTIFTDFDKAFDALCNWVVQDFPMVDVPKPKRAGAFNFSHRGGHYQIWETNFPPNNFNDERN